MGSKYFEALENSIERLKKTPKSAERDKKIKELEGKLSSGASRQNFAEAGDLSIGGSLEFQDKLYRQK